MEPIVQENRARRWLLARLLGLAPEDWPGTAGDAQVLKAMVRRNALEPWAGFRAIARWGPTELGAYWRASSASMAMRSYRLMSDLVRLDQRFRARGVQPVWLKGAALLGGGYLSPGSRHIEDIDLLLPADTFELAREVLQEAGATIGADWPRFRVDGADARWNYQPRFHAMAPWDLPSGTRVDVHFRISGTGFGDPLEWEHVAARSLEVEWAGHHFLVPDRVTLAQTLAMHTVWHHLAEPRGWAKLLLDLEALGATSRAKWKHYAGEAWKENLTLYACLVLREVLVKEPTHKLGVLICPPAVRARRLDHGVETLELLLRIARDFRYRPFYLARKVWPHRRFVEHQIGAPSGTSSPLQRVAFRLRRLGPLPTKVSS